MAACTRLPNQVKALEQLLIVRIEGCRDMPPLEEATSFTPQNCTRSAVPAGEVLSLREAALKKRQRMALVSVQCSLYPRRDLKRRMNVSIAASLLAVPVSRHHSESVERRSRLMALKSGSDMNCCWKTTDGLDNNCVCS